MTTVSIPAAVLTKVEPPDVRYCVSVMTSIPVAPAGSVVVCEPASAAVSVRWPVGSGVTTTTCVVGSSGVCDARVVAGEVVVGGVVREVWLSVATGADEVITADDEGATDEAKGSEMDSEDVSEPARDEIGGPDEAGGEEEGAGEMSDAELQGGRSGQGRRLRAADDPVVFVHALEEDGV
jgi:hypothetical protein